MGERIEHGHRRLHDCRRVFIPRSDQLRDDNCSFRAALRYLSRPILCAVHSALVVTTCSLPHCRKSQPIRTHMCADDRGHIDHQDIARHGLAGFLHQLIQEFSGAWFGTRMQDCQSFQRTPSNRNLDIRSLAWLCRPHRADGLDLPICQFDQRLDAQEASKHGNRGRDAPAALEIFHGVQGGIDMQPSVRGFDGLERGLHSQLGGFGSSKHLEAKSQRKGGAIDTGNPLRRNHRLPGARYSGWRSARRPRGWRGYGHSRALRRAS